MKISQTFVRFTTQEMSFRKHLGTIALTLDIKKDSAFICQSLFEGKIITLMGANYQTQMA